VHVQKNLLFPVHLAYDRALTREFTPRVSWQN
jgi:hypothetical protein